MKDCLRECDKIPLSIIELMRRRRQLQRTKMGVHTINPVRSCFYTALSVQGLSRFVCSERAATPARTLCTWNNVFFFLVLKSFHVITTMSGQVIAHRWRDVSILSLPKAIPQLNTAKTVTVLLECVYHIYNYPHSHLASESSELLDRRRLEVFWC